MKKLMIVFMCFVLCFSFIGCNKREKTKEEVKEILQMVLENEQTFTAQTCVFAATLYPRSFNIAWIFPAPKI